MELSIAANLASVSFFAVIALTGFLRIIAKKYRLLIDLPDINRKFHSRPTPLVGGIGIHIAMLFGLSMLYLSVDMKFYDETRNINFIKSNVEVEFLGEENVFDIIASRATDQESRNSYVINFDRGENSVLIYRNASGNFEYENPDGSIQEFSYIDGKVVNLDNNNSISVLGSDISEYFSIDITMLSIVIAAILFQLVMLKDDYSGMRQLEKLAAQALASALVIFISGTYIENIGISILGWQGSLGLMGIPFTIIAVTGLINAFNMIDGINGLCSGLTLIAFICLSLAAGNTSINYGSIIIIFSIAGFMIYNLELFGEKRGVFLGDNGSNLLGFLVAWSCINFSSSGISLISPVTALWLVIIPLWDCLSLIYLRLIKGKGAFDADRNHIHHILHDSYNLSNEKILLMLLSAGLIFGLFGIYLNYEANSSMSFLLFLLTGFMLSVFKNKLLVKVY